MIENFLVIFQQIIILFVLVLSGFFCGKAKLISEQGIKTLTNVVLYLATPCVIITSYIREFSAALLGDLLISLAMSFLVHIVAIIIAKIVFPTKNRTDKTSVMHYAIVFSNAGYMGLPLQKAILGDAGVFFGASYVAVFNIMCWTYGLWCMSKESGSFSAKRLINPGVVSVIIGIIIFVCSIPVHPSIKDALIHLGNLNTPLPMLIIGYYLSKANLVDALKNKGVYAVSFLRLVLVPLCALGVMYLIGIRGTMLVSMVIAASAPVATATSMFTLLCGRDEQTSVNLVSVTTVLSLITMSVIVALSQTVA